MLSVYPVQSGLYHDLGGRFSGLTPSHLVVWCSRMPVLSLVFERIGLGCPSPRHLRCPRHLLRVLSVFGDVCIDFVA